MVVRGEVEGWDGGKEGKEKGGRNISQREEELPLGKKKNQIWSGKPPLPPLQGGEGKTKETLEVRVESSWTFSL